MLARMNNYDLIILDIMLPKMDGIELCKKITQYRSSTYIIMLTAKDSVEDKVSALDSGADDYITKPFSFDELLARVRALMRRREQDINEFKFKNLKVNSFSHKVYVDNKEIVLRPKEYSILIYLIKNNGRVVSRTRILENVWGYDFNPNTNVVDVHIKHLRDKLGECPSLANLIQSIRGVGYIIDDQSE
jgi:DNA-binding response OmpR family regulator